MCLHGCEREVKEELCSGSFRTWQGPDVNVTFNVATNMVKDWVCLGPETETCNYIPAANYDFNCTNGTVQVLAEDGWESSPDARVPGNCMCVSKGPEGNRTEPASNSTEEVETDARARLALYSTVAGTEVGGRAEMAPVAVGLGATAGAVATLAALVAWGRAHTSSATDEKATKTLE